MKKILFSLLAALILIIAFAPQLASTKWGSELFLKMIDPHLEAESLALTWKGPQVAKEIKWEKEDVVISAKELASESSFFALIFQKHKAPFRFMGGSISYKNERLENLDGAFEISPENWEMLVTGDGFKGRGRYDIETKMLAAAGEVGLKGIWEIGGKRLPNGTFEGRIGTKEIPSGLLEVGLYLLTGKKIPFETILGETTSFLFVYEEGLVDLKLKSSHASLALKAKKERDLLHLLAPLEASLHLSAKHRGAALPPDNPLGIFQISSEEPMLLTVPEKGSQIPLNVHQLALLDLPVSRLEAGMLHATLFGPFGTILQMLQMPNDQDLTLWFGPLDFSVERGKMQIERTDFLINREVQIAFWGTVDLPTKKVRLILGLPASTLARVLKIEELPRDYVLQIPLKGDFSQIKIDRKALAKKFTALLLWDKACKEGLPLPPLPDCQKKAPHPAERLPWNTYLE